MLFLEEGAIHACTQDVVPAMRKVLEDVRAGTNDHFDSTRWELPNTIMLRSVMASIADATSNAQA